MYYKVSLIYLIFLFKVLGLNSINNLRVNRGIIKG